MKRSYLAITLLCLAAYMAAQDVYVSPETLAKRERRKNLTVKEWNTNDKTGGKVLKEVEYNDKNKPYRIRKYEYNTNGTKAKQYNYLPNGKLESVKVFEYIFQK